MDFTSIRYNGARSSVTLPRCLRGSAAEQALDRSAKRGRVDRREAIQLRLDRLELSPRGRGVDQAAGDHLLRGADVLFVPTLGLRERLGDWIKVMQSDPSCPEADRPDA